MLATFPKIKQNDFSLTLKLSRKYLTDSEDLIQNPGSTNGSSLSQKESVKSEEKRKQTENQFLNDDGLKELQEVFNSQVDVKSIKSIKESDNV